MQKKSNDNRLIEFDKRQEENNEKLDLLIVMEKKLFDKKTVSFQ